MRVEITDVFLRDGLQDEPVVVPTREKVRIAGLLEDSGVTRLEAAAFVSPRRVPQMADAAEVFAARPTSSRAAWTALALNGRGVERAVAAGVNEVQVVASASRAHSRANAGGDAQDLIAGMVPLVQAHPQTHFYAGISTAFTCPYEGNVEPEHLMSVARAFLDLGITDIGLADTLGNTEPDRLLATLERFREELPQVSLSLHLHNAHGRALETVTGALELGVVRYDSALGGFGGCPFAPGAAGNLDTLELVQHLHGLGAETGIDVEELRAAGDTARAVVSESPAVREVSDSHSSQKSSGGEDVRS